MRLAIAAAATIMAMSCAHGAEFSFVKRDASHGAVMMFGEIKQGDDLKFTDFLKSHPKPEAIVLSSPGGLILPAMRIGEQIREANIATMVVGTSVCASACADIWLSGIHRYYDRTAHIGFHGAFGNNGKTLEMTGSGNALVGAYLARLGYSDFAILFATAAKPNELMWLPHEMTDNGITFEPIDTAPAQQPMNVTPAPVQGSAERADLLNMAAGRTPKPKLGMPFGWIN